MFQGLPPFEEMEMVTVYISYLAPPKNPFKQDVKPKLSWEA